MNRNDEEQKTWILARQAGAIEWIGILPGNLIAKVLDDETEFVLLVMPNLPEARGKELIPAMMDESGAKLLLIKEIVVEEVI